jgi:hypothetical protein
LLFLQSFLFFCQLFFQFHYWILATLTCVTHKIKHWTKEMVTTNIVNSCPVQIFIYMETKMWTIISHNTCCLPCLWTWNTAIQLS